MYVSKKNLNKLWCPWCGRIKNLSGNWKQGPAEIPEAAFAKICPKCFEKVMEEEKMKNKRYGGLF